MYVAPAHEHVVKHSADCRGERDGARLVPGGAVGADGYRGFRVVAGAGLYGEGGEVYGGKRGGAFEDGQSQAARHLGVVGLREGAVQHVLSVRRLVRRAEVVEVDCLEGGDAGERRSCLRREKPLAGGSPVYFQSQRSEIRAGNHLLQPACAGLAALLVERAVEVALRYLVEIAALRVDYHLASARRNAVFAHLYARPRRQTLAAEFRYVLHVLDVSAVGAGAEYEADVRRIHALALGGLGGEQRRDRIVYYGDLSAAQALQEFRAHVLPDDGRGLDVLRPAHEPRVEGGRRFRRIREAPAELAAAGERRKPPHLRRERLVELFFAGLRFRAGHRAVLAVQDFRRDFDYRAAEIRPSGVKHRRSRPFAHLPANSYERRNHQHRRRFSGEPALHFGEQIAYQELVVKLRCADKAAVAQKVFRRLHCPPLLS